MYVKLQMDIFFMYSIKTSTDTPVKTEHPTIRGMKKLLLGSERDGKMLLNAVVRHSQL